MTEPRLEELFRELYENRFIQTLWNAEKQKNREQGWLLLSGQLAPWFFNMRPIGDAPMTFVKVCREMASLISGQELDLGVGTEMAGIPPVVGISVISTLVGKPFRFAYTRPLSKKVHQPSELPQLLQKLSEVTDYSQKEFVEGRMCDGDEVGIFDDMATNLGSKIIARALVLWDAQRRGVNISCRHINYFLDRGQGNIQRGRDFANETDPRLFPEELDVHYVLHFNDYLPCLENVMSTNEFSLICQHQQNPERFGKDEAWRKEQIAIALAERK